MCRFAICLAPALLIGAAAAPGHSPSPPDVAAVTITAPDGAALKATYFSPGRPGPGILLLHACNRDRTSWTGLATGAAERGYHVLALDYRGYGESGGTRSDDPQEQQSVITHTWPGDIDAAFSWLVAQRGVDRARIAAAGASCGVNQSLLLARRHPEVKTVVLLSGGATPPAREYLRETPGLPVFAAASLDDGNAVSGMKWLLGWSRNEHNRFVQYQAAGHGTDMFEVEGRLPGLILEWFDQRLRTAPAVLPKPATLPPPSAVEQFWTMLTGPGGVARARRMFEETKQRDPDTVLFPEGEANLHGYSLLQAGNVKDAIAVFEMNVAAYPKSSNTYDSLADAHLAAGNRAEALRLAEKALAMLETDETTPAAFKELIRESAEKKVKELRGK